MLDDKYHLTPNYNKIKRSGPGRTRTYEALPQLIYSQPPLPLGTRTLIMKLDLLSC